jgi:hypothetical protein
VVDDGAHWEHDSLSCTMVTAGKKTTEQFGIFFFPNPASKKVMVQNPEVIRCIRFRNAEGRMIKESYPDADQFETEVSEFPEGLYWAELIAESGSIRRQKLIINR